jgi:hypothetical protein
MPRSKDVNLPALRRARGGHVIYGPGEESVCPYHQFCAYSGDEPGRCSQCHGLLDEDDICPHLDLPPGRSSPCMCVTCLEVFSSITAFVKHKGSTGKCLNPARRKLVLVTQGDWDIWANPGTRPERD